jgi:c(7)-type cytochrome triheme protein
MSKFCFFAATLLALVALAVPPMAQAQETAQAADAQQETPAAPPARRPKMPSVITFESALGEVQFPHRVHQKMGCANCHHQIHAKTLVTPHEEYLTYSWVNCGDCHDADTAISTSYYGCDHCHHSNLENIADETLTAKVVIHKSCWNCHLSGTGVEASERCSFCHEQAETPPALSPENAEAALE